MILDIETANRAIKTTDKAIKLYNEVLDRVVPWKAFKETLAELDKYNADYSGQSASLIGEIKSRMKSGINAYYRASELIFGWCETATPLLTTYVELFIDHTVEKAHTQKDLLVEVLTKGVTEMSAAQSAISRSSISFNGVTGKLTTLNSRFRDEFNGKSAFFQSQIDTMRKYGWTIWTAWHDSL